MGWIQKLYETYQQCEASACVPDAAGALEPICHTSQQAQIEVRIRGDGTFLGARVLPKDEAATLVPCTEASVGRTGKKPVCHPLCDKLQYVAADFTRFGGAVTSGFAANPAEPHESYMALLGRWADSEFSHPKLGALLAYLRRGCLVADLVREQVLPVHEVDGVTVLQTAWTGGKDATPKIFGVIAAGNAPEDAFIRWRIEFAGEILPETWRDRSLIQAWTGFYLSQNQQRGLCMATGGTVMLASQHPAKLRHGADKAKLISSNDSSGFTFRGRFSDAGQACAVGFEVSQKAHNALRWLIRRQGYRHGDQALVAWAVSGAPVPSPTDDLYDIYAAEEAAANGGDAAGVEEEPEPASDGNAGQVYGLRLAKLRAGFQAGLGKRDGVVVMALESATPGRVAVTYYRELDAGEYVGRIEAWHSRHAWPLNLSKDKKFIGAPAPDDIAEAAYGMRLDAKLRKATVERLLPCIVEGWRLPRDLMEAVVRRATNRAGLDHWEWEKCLGIACALFRGFHIEGGYHMALDTERDSRDYLFGRLLAVAENIEAFALYKAGERRETSAARLMQRFAEHPCSTWLTITLALAPYKTRLRSSGPGFLHVQECLLDEIVSRFRPDDFTRDGKLTGEFLLGYHCQRAALRKKAEPGADAGGAEESDGALTGQ